MVLQPGDFVVGPVRPESAGGGGIDIDYCAFPTCPGNPRGIVSAPALCFCMLLPPPSSPTLSTSHRQLSRALSLSLSPASTASSFSLSLGLSLRGESTHPRIFSRESIRRFALSRAWVSGDLAASPASFIPPETSTAKGRRSLTRVVAARCTRHLLSEYNFTLGESVSHPNSSDFAQPRANVLAGRADIPCRHRGREFALAERSLARGRDARFRVFPHTVARSDIFHARGASRN